MRIDKGRLFVISGPSGAGKSTVISRVIADREDLQFSVSATTRAPRKGEVDGENYHFVDRARFEQMIKDGELLEYVEYVDSYYGTPIKPILQSLEKGVNILLDIEVVGAGNVRKVMPDAVMIFLAPPSMEELERRLRGRGDVPEEKIISRLERAKMEYREIPKYDYIVINDNADDAATELRSIILAEQCRTSNRLQYLSE
ncbi:MAG: guanylate kinase [Oscillospiraceae bacterium]|nr:guanylate kinase [Oscillospiraceae bacterium]